jgi:RNA polymerase sigma-70 factor (ECF subfamily)
VALTLAREAPHGAVARRGVRMASGSAAVLARLAGRARDGDAQAFRALVEATHQRLFALAAALSGDRDEAADVVQEAFARAWERRGELHRPEAALAWLFAIVRHAAGDRRRGWWRRRRPLEEAPEEAGGPRGDEALAAAEEAAAVRRALHRLPERHRVVLVLRELEGFTAAEVAEALGVPVGTVDSRLHRARLGLARGLARARREEVRP